MKNLRLHNVYKEILERTINKIFAIKGATYGKARGYRVIGENKIRWRMIEYHILNDKEIVTVIPPLITRKNRVVVEKPVEVKEKIEDILVIRKNAYVTALVTKDMDDRGVREIKHERYFIMKFPEISENKLKYFYVPIILGMIRDVTTLNRLLHRYVSFQVDPEKISEREVKSILKL